ncbi:MAG TPA: FemAB family XrtA/PEP-CTERM system-associated protein [Rhizomicrobium sp.]|jgi:FemAB-related protein (PEP-CTERM system-associated)|nr:FemAB family XrtA/PEP-CTERM system-associated protein [Rhizomicrobium sp.]
MDGISVSLLESNDEPAWDAFIQEAPSATFFHRVGWKRVIEKAFGHRTFYLAARRRGAICGVLPLTRVKSLFFGHSLISNAFCVRGGPVAEYPEIRDELESEAIRLTRELGAECLEFRSEACSGSGWQIRDGVYANFSRKIAPDSGTNLKSIPRKQRAMIRKGIANGLKAEIEEDVRRFHHVYAQSVRNLGTPVFSRRYFQLLKEEFGRDCDIITILSGAEPVASVLNFYFRDQVLPYYGGGTAQARTLAGNDFMYWEVMRRASERGYGVFDFGRSKIGTGAYDFKRNWGFESSPFAYTYYSLGTRSVGSVNPLNPKYQAAISLWQRLPLPVTKLIGPAIVRSIG